MAAGDLWLAGSTPDDVYRSEDDGATWTSEGITAPSGQASVTGIAVAPNGDLWLARETARTMFTVLRMMVPLGDQRRDNRSFHQGRPSFQVLPFPQMVTSGAGNNPELAMFTVLRMMVPLGPALGIFGQLHPGRPSLQVLL